MNFVMEMFAQMISEMFVEGFIGLFVPRTARKGTVGTAQHSRDDAKVVGSVRPTKNWIAIDRVAAGRRGT
jgi:hypothetical protein